MVELIITTVLLEDVPPGFKSGLLLVLLGNLVKGGLVAAAPADPGGITGQVRSVAKSPLVKQWHHKLYSILPFSVTDGEVLHPKRCHSQHKLIVCGRNVAFPLPTFLLWGVRYQ